MRISLLFPLAFSSMVGAPLQAQIAVGDPAPKLDVQFLEGPPQDPTAADGKVYLVEFWATWCAPCRESIPHLAGLARKHEKDGLVVIGVTDEDAATVRDFDLLEQMTYHVACDPENESHGIWTEGIDGIPTAFLVEKTGKVAWIGHPLDPGLERVLGRILAGTFDLEAEKERARAIAELRRRFEEATGNDDVDAALAILDEMLLLEPHDIEHYELKVQLATYAERPEVVLEARRGAAQAFRDDPDTLNEIAWEILTSSELDGDAIALALSVARHAADLAEADASIDADTRASVLDTLARAWYAVGRLDRAILVQEQAVTAGAASEFLPFLESNLAAYRKLTELGEKGPAKF